MRVLSPDACGATRRHQRIHACAECYGARVLKRPQGTRALQYIYILDPENFDREKYIYTRHFEICYIILRTQIHHMLNIYAKVVTRRPNPTAYGHLVDVLSFKWTI